MGLNSIKNMGLIAWGGTGHRIDCYLSAMGLLAAYVWLCVWRCGLLERPVGVLGLACNTPKEKRDKART